MKLANVAPIKVGQYARYKEIYVWKCADVRFRNNNWYITGTVVVGDGIIYVPGMPVSGYWYPDDKVLTEEEVNEAIERASN